MLRLMAPVVMDPATDQMRRGLLQQEIANLIGIPVKEVSIAIRKLAANPPRPVDPMAQAGKVSSDVGPIDASPPIAQCWVIGLLLTDFSLYESFRDEITQELFTPEQLRPLAVKLLEYLDGAMDFGSCSLAEFLGALDENMVKQAIAIQAEAEKGIKLKQRMADALRILRHERELHLNRQKTSTAKEEPNWGEMVKTINQADKSGVNRRSAVQHQRSPKDGV